MNGILVESIVTRDLRPIVTLKWGRESGQFTPEEARQHALSILEAAEAAEGECFFARFMTDEAGFSEQQIAGALGEFRKFRFQQGTNNTP